MASRIVPGGAQGERREQSVERPRGRLERQRLEVSGVVFRDVHTDGDVLIAADVGVLRRRAFGPNRVDESIGEVGDRVPGVRHGGWLLGVAGTQGGEATRGRTEILLEEDPDPFRFEVELLADLARVDERLLARVVGALVEQVAASEPVGDADEHHSAEQRDESEEQRDTGAKAQRALTGGSCHADSVSGEQGTGSSHAAGEAPGGGRYPTGAA